MSMSMYDFIGGGDLYFVFGVLFFYLIFWQSIIVTTAPLTGGRKKTLSVRKRL